jgi:hypothetical protein
MQITSTRPTSFPKAAAQVTQPAQQQAPASDSFTFSGSQSEKGRTSLFHRVTGGAAGGVVGAVAGVMLLGAAGNGKGAEGLIYPLIGLAGGGAAGIAGGAFLAGTVTSTEERTSPLHRATGLVAGAAAGAVVGTLLLTPMGNGMGGEGLIYPLMGFAGGTLVGGGAGVWAAGGHPDK